VNNSFRIGRILGINVYIHISWFLVFVLFSLTLSEGYFPAAAPNLSKINYWLMGSIVTLILFGSILLHELAHSITAIKHNLPIKRITLFIFGGVAQIEREPDHPAAEFKIAIAGPLASLATALFFAVLYWLFPGVVAVKVALKYLAQVNVFLVLINLVPAFPLDGGRLLRALLWSFFKNLLRATRVAVNLGSFFAFLSIALGFIMVIYQNLIGGIWYIFLGWLLHQAGQNIYGQLALKQAFTGVKIFDVMTRDVVTVEAGLTINELVERFFRYKYGAFPVVDNDEVVGMVSLHQVKEVPRREWDFKKVGEIMTPLEKCYRVEPEQEAVEVMLKMAAEDEGRALVMEDGNLVGILSRTDIMRLINMHLVLGTGDR